MLVGRNVNQKAVLRQKFEQVANGAARKAWGVNQAITSARQNNLATHWGLILIDSFKKKK